MERDVMEAQPAIKRSMLKELIALLVFVFIAGSAALPLLCPGGEKIGALKATLVFLAFCRLAWHTYKRTFRFRDYFIYFALVIGFCLWADANTCK
jgi:hypothetical protein